MCDMICMSFPLSKLMTLTDFEVPCISLKNRLAIARFRDDFNFQRSLTQSLVTTLQVGGGRQKVLCPPDFKKLRLSLFYDEYVYDMLRCFVSHGVLLEDPSIQSFFLGKNAKGPSKREFDKEFLGRKRVLTLKTYTALVNAGFDLNAGKFIIVDESDKRTQFIRPEIKRAREQWNSGMPLSRIREVRERVESFVRIEREEGEEDEVIKDRVLFILQRELDTDLSDNIGQIESLIDEVGREN